MNGAMESTIHQAQKVYDSLATTAEVVPRLQMLAKHHEGYLQNLTLKVGEAGVQFGEHVAQNNVLLKEQAGYINAIANHNLDIGTGFIFFVFPLLFRVLVPGSPTLAAIACGLFFTFYRTFLHVFAPIRATINWTWKVMLSPTIHSYLEIELGENYREHIFYGLSLALYLTAFGVAIHLLMSFCKFLVQRRRQSTIILPLHNSATKPFDIIAAVSEKTLGDNGLSG
jgi:hypothetical protein